MNISPHASKFDDIPNHTPGWYRRELQKAQEELRALRFELVRKNQAIEMLTRDLAAARQQAQVMS